MTVVATVETEMSGSGQEGPGAQVRRRCPFLVVQAIIWELLQLSSCNECQKDGDHLGARMRTTAGFMRSIDKP